MKKIVIILLFSMFLARTCYAENLFDKIMYKNVLIMAVGQHALVNRITEQIAYIVLNNGKLVAPKGPAKLQYQAMYDLQRK